MTTKINIKEPAYQEAEANPGCRPNWCKTSDLLLGMSFCTTAMTGLGNTPSLHSDPVSTAPAPPPWVAPAVPEGGSLGQGRRPSAAFLLMEVSNVFSFSV